MIFVLLLNGIVGWLGMVVFLFFVFLVGGFIVGLVCLWVVISGIGFDCVGWGCCCSLVVGYVSLVLCVGRDLREKMEIGEVEF